MYKLGADITVDKRLTTPPHHLPDGQRAALLDQLKRKQKQASDPEIGLVVDIDYYEMWPEQDINVNKFLVRAQNVADSFEDELLSDRSS